MFDANWFGFVLQVVGIAVAGWVVLGVLGSARRGAFTLALAGVALALLGGQYALGVRPAENYLKSVDKKFTITDQAGGRTWCVNEPGLPDLNYIRFLQAHLPERARYMLYLPEAQVATAVPMCLALILSPRAQTTEESRTQYRVFFGLIPPDLAGQAVASNPAYTFYAPNMGILKVGS